MGQRQCGVRRLNVEQPIDACPGEDHQVAAINRVEAAGDDVEATRLRDGDDDRRGAATECDQSTAAVHGIREARSPCNSLLRPQHGPSPC